MTNDRLSQVAIELALSGFATNEYYNQDTGESYIVEVRLKNRKPSAMEVESALEQIFEDVQFNVKSSTNCVIVRM